MAEKLKSFFLAILLTAFLLFIPARINLMAIITKANFLDIKLINTSLFDYFGNVFRLFSKTVGENHL